MHYIYTLIVLILFATSASAENFSPTPLKISAPDIVHYDFDGSTLNIPITLSGKPATMIFMVYTSDMADAIAPTRNGFLGWHYVNKVDTCVYVAPSNIMDIGSNTVAWNGENNENIQIPAGEYTYYLYGYDSINSKMLATSLLTVGYNIGNIVTHDADGTPKAQPV